MPELHSSSPFCPSHTLGRAFAHARVSFDGVTYTHLAGHLAHSRSHARRHISRVSLAVPPKTETENRRTPAPRSTHLANKTQPSPGHHNRTSHGQSAYHTRWSPQRPRPRPCECCAFLACHHQSTYGRLPRTTAQSGDGISRTTARFGDAFSSHPISRRRLHRHGHRL